MNYTQLQASFKLCQVLGQECISFKKEQIHKYVKVKCCEGNLSTSLIGWLSWIAGTEELGFNCCIQLLGREMNDAIQLQPSRIKENISTLGFALSQTKIKPFTEIILFVRLFEKTLMIYCVLPIQIRLYVSHRRSYYSIKKKNKPVFGNACR